MKDAKLKLVDRDIDIKSDVTSIGRTSDNNVALTEDVNISRFHAEIERRGEDYYLIDLDSSNGTTVNGQKLTGETRLNSGDQLTFGGTSKAQFVIGDVAEIGEAKSFPVTTAAESPVAGTTPGGAASESVSETPAAASSRTTVMVAGGVCTVAVVCLVAAGGFYYMKGSQCSAKAVIVKPETGDTIKKPTEIEVHTSDGSSASTAVFTIDGKPFATSSENPYSATIDPKQFPELADGDIHLLEVVLIDADGSPIRQDKGIELAFDTRAVVKPEATPVVIATGPTPKPAGGKVSLQQVQQMSQELVKEFPGAPAYAFTNQQFLQEILKRTPDYVQEGYSQRAAAYKDKINMAFVQQHDTVPLGYMLAMSRSKFVPAAQTDGEGLWRMQNSFVTDLNYNGTCTTKALADADCDATSNAVYLKAIEDLFPNDPAYAAAAFGKSPQDAAAWRSTLAANRNDIWNTIKTAPEREQVLRFFAAGIVAQNPQKFGLAKDRPLSDLYRITQ